MTDLPRPDDSWGIPNPVPLAGTLYVRTSTHLRGPFNVSVLRAMQARGEIRRDTLISPDRLRWVAASDLPELFPSGLFTRTAPTTERESLWHVMIEGYRQGPISWDSLYELAETGKLRAFDKVTVDGGDQWILASAVHGLPVPEDSGPNVLSGTKVSWLVGGTVAASLLLIIPLILMLTWNEKRISRDLGERDREDEQSHASALQNSMNESREELERISTGSSERIAEMQSESEVEAARLNAAAQGAMIAREQDRHDQKMAAAEAQRRATEENTSATLDASRQQTDAIKEVQNSVDANTRAIQNR